MRSKANPARWTEVTHFNAVGDAVVMVMSTAPVSGTLCASTNDQEKKSELWILRERWLREQPSHGLQQLFGVRPQRFPPGLGPPCPVLHGEGRPIRRPRAAMLDCDSMSGNLLFPDDEPETDTSATFRTLNQRCQVSAWNAADSLQRRKGEAFEAVSTPAGQNTRFTFVTCGNGPLMRFQRVLTWRRTCRVKQLCRTEAPGGGHYSRDAHQYNSSRLLSSVQQILRHF